MSLRSGQWVTGTTISSGLEITGRYLGPARDHDGRAVVTVIDEERPELRHPYHVFVDTLVVHGARPEGALMEPTIEMARLLVQTVDDSRRYLAKCREMGDSHIPDDFVEGKVLYVLTMGQPYWTEG